MHPERAPLHHTARDRSSKSTISCRRIMLHVSKRSVSEECMRPDVRAVTGQSPSTSKLSDRLAVSAKPLIDQSRSDCNLCTLASYTMFTKSHGISTSVMCCSLFSSSGTQCGSDCHCAFDTGAELRTVALYMNLLSRRDSSNGCCCHSTRA